MEIRPPPPSAPHSPTLGESRLGSHAPDTSDERQLHWVSLTWQCSSDWPCDTLPRIHHESREGSGATPSSTATDLHSTAVSARPARLTPQGVGLHRPSRDSTTQCRPA